MPAQRSLSSVSTAQALQTGALRRILKQTMNTALQDTSFLVATRLIRSITPTSTLATPIPQMLTTSPLESQSQLWTPTSECGPAMGTLAQLRTRVMAIPLPILQSLQTLAAQGSSQYHVK